MIHKKLNDLHELAKLYNIQTAFYDVFKQRQFVEEETLLAILRSFKVDIHSENEIKHFLLEFFPDFINQITNRKLINMI